MNKVVVTGADQSMWNVLDLTLNSKLKYCKQHSYDLIIKRHFNEIEQCGFTKKNIGTSYIGFVRAWECFTLLQQYDVVMWLDGDSIITNPNITIDDMIDSKHTFYSSYDWLCYEGGPAGKNGFSTGNFIIRRTEDVNDLFNKFYETSQYYLHNIMAEQITLNIIHQHNDIVNCFKILEHKYLNSVPLCLTKTKTWLNDPVRTGPNAQNLIINEWTKESFIAHLTGITNYEREEVLKTHFNQYI
jgi:hypothetical protein